MWNLTLCTSYCVCTLHVEIQSGVRWAMTLAMKLAGECPDLVNISQGLNEWEFDKGYSHSTPRKCKVMASKALWEWEVSCLLETSRWISPNNWVYLSNTHVPLALTKNSKNGVASEIVPGTDWNGLTLMLAEIMVTTTNAPHPEGKLTQVALLVHVLSKK